MEALAVPFLHRFNLFLDYFRSLSPLAGAGRQREMTVILLAGRLGYYNIITEARRIESKERWQH